MTTIARLLDVARAKTEQKTDSAVADAIGVTRSAVSVWRSGGVITEKHLAALVAFAGADPTIAVEVLKEQAQTPAQKAVWGGLRDRLLPLMSSVRRAFGLSSRQQPEAGPPH